MELVLATGNRDKQQEMKALLQDLGLTIRTLDEFPAAPVVVEDGETCQENAGKKAREIAQFTGALTLADDTGLEVDALGGRPGVFAARYAGIHATYADNCRKLLDELTGSPGGSTGGSFSDGGGHCRSCFFRRVRGGCVAGTDRGPLLRRPRVWV